ncbi:MAG: hypothetical protein ACYTFX_09645 [Planctomycetota bacterium]
MRRAASGSRVGAWGTLLEARPGVWVNRYWNATYRPVRVAQHEPIWFEIEQIEQIGE